MGRFGGIGAYLSLKPRGERLRDTIWFVPLLMMVCAYLAAVTLEHVQAWMEGSATVQGLLRDTFPDWALPTDPQVVADTKDGIKSSLSTLTGALISTITLLISVTLVAVQLATSQMGPRLIGDFLRNRVVQVTIGLFLGTWIFGNRTTSSMSRDVQLPYLGQVSTQLLTGACLIMLVLFVQAVVSEVRIPVVLPRLVREVDQLLPRDFEGGRMEAPAGPGTRVPAARTGYLDSIHTEALVRWARRHGTVVVLAHAPGEFVIQGTPILTMDTRIELSGRDLRRLDRWITLCPLPRTGSTVRGPVFRIVEIALRALSPALNDTNTGLACVEWLGEAFRRLIPIPEAPEGHTDKQGALRVITWRTDIAALAEQAFGMIRVSAKDNPVVLVRILRVFRDLGHLPLTGALRRTLLEEGDRVLATARDHVRPAGDVHAVEKAHRVMRRALAL
ncbi:DUF2254 domain-containing protein [Nonomuraea sediminis]|uniref:DUF2254 domain-containing protein n=1 Tax=Nonomuraea sediminis TaxID=2835864 RepID=UPI001BDDA166|nr:DUF2254 family protein [Nonomuraea sediminis]